MYHSKTIQSIEEKKKKEKVKKDKSNIMGKIRNLNQICLMAGKKKQFLPFSFKRQPFENFVLAMAVVN